MRSTSGPAPVCGGSSTTMSTCWPAAASAGSTSSTAPSCSSMPSRSPAFVAKSSHAAAFDSIADNMRAGIREWDREEPDAAIGVEDDLARLDRWHSPARRRPARPRPRCWAGSSSARKPGKSYPRPRRTSGPGRSRVELSFPSGARSRPAGRSRVRARRPQSRTAPALRPSSCSPESSPPSVPARRRRARREAGRFGR